MSDVWTPVVGGRFFARNGFGLYERLTPDLYLRIDDLDEADEVECCRQIAGLCGADQSVMTISGPVPRD
jgi:hypothetical protein